mgnify:CR=1 FL=1
MEFSSIPIIVIICYLIGEIYKVIFNNNHKLYKLIPILNAMLGGILGVLIFFTNKEIMLNVSNVWSAICIGIVSGVSSTGTNQIIKKIFKNKNN